jgi:hypothetical protein
MHPTPLNIADIMVAVNVVRLVAWHAREHMELTQSFVWCTALLTDSMDLKPSLEAMTCTATQERSNIL